jgi:ribosome-binding factor A
MHHRQERVADAIREAVARILLNDVSDPNIGFVTVTRCTMTRDLKIATVYFSILGDKKARKSGLEHLERARRYIRRLLTQHINLRYTPELRFAPDDLLVEERRVSKLLDDIMPDDAAAAEAEDDSPSDPE